MIDAGDDALHPAIEIAGDIGDGFACAERGGGLGVIEENDRAAHALDADVESDARAERRLFENEGDEFTLQRGSVADGTRFYVGGEVEKFAGVRGTPLGSGEQIVGQRNGRYKSRCGHFLPRCGVREARRIGGGLRGSSRNGFGSFCENEFEETEEFANLRAGDDEWGQEAQGEIVRAIDYQALTQSFGGER